jgi:hypothetical protein
MPLTVEVEDTSPGVARDSEGDHAGEEGGLVGGGDDDVGGEGGRVPVGVVNPDPGVEVLSVALGVGDVVSVGEQNMVDPAGILDRPGEGPAPVRGVDEERVAGLGDEPGVGLCSQDRDLESCVLARRVAGLWAVACTAGAGAFLIIPAMLWSR